MRLTLAALSVFFVSALAAQQGGELRFCIKSDPKTFNPILVEDAVSETVRYLTGGVLIRLNRRTQELQPELALAWKVSQQGRSISFHLRRGLRFSDETPFSAADVVYTLKALIDPAAHSPVADSFRSAAGPLQVMAAGEDSVTVTFPAPVADIERRFDQVAILSARSPKKEMAVMGPFFIADYRPGVELTLRRNPFYWKRDAGGQRLPYLDTIRLSIQQNREVELLRFRRGQLHLITNLDPQSFDDLARTSPASAYDAGPSLDSEFLWFNQASGAPLAPYKKAWFSSKEFRRAVSEAINRDDLCRVVYRGHAQPAAGPISPANRFWFNAALRPQRFDPAASLQRLQRAGFRLAGQTLRDREGHAVEFSAITNAGNKAREKMAEMIQQDLSSIGIRLNVVALDFPSLIERITRNFQYEACLLGLTNYDLDPNAQMNVWLSSAGNHQWNPNQKTPETPWEAEIDRLMRVQSSELDRKKRKLAFDKVQQIVREEAPFVYLVHRNDLMAISPALHNVAPAALHPQAYWNAEVLSLKTEISRSGH